MNFNNIATLSINNRPIVELKLDGRVIWRGEFDVGFYDKDSELIAGSQQKVLYGNSATAPNPPTYDEYYFSKWLQDFSKIKDDLSVQSEYIKYLSVDYKFKSDRSFITSQKYKVSSDVSYIDLPERKYYTISGFEPEEPPKKNKF